MPSSDHEQGVSRSGRYAQQMKETITIVSREYRDGAECWTVSYSCPWGNTTTTYYDWSQVALFLARRIGPEEERSEKATCDQEET